MNKVLKFPSGDPVKGNGSSEINKDDDSKHHIAIINYCNGERKIVDLNSDYQGAIELAKNNARVFGDRIESIEICMVKLIPRGKIGKDLISRIAEEI